MPRIRANLDDPQTQRLAEETQPEHLAGTRGRVLQGLAHEVHLFAVASGLPALMLFVYPDEGAHLFGKDFLLRDDRAGLFKRFAT